MCFIFSVYYDTPMTETCMQIHESATCHVYKALNAIHVQCSAGHVPVYTSDTRYIQQANLADPSCLQVDLQCSVYFNSSTIISSPLSNTILPEGHHRRPLRDLTTRTPFTRKHPGHTQCLLTSHSHPSMMRVRKLAEEPWTQESWTHQQLSTAQLVQMMEEMVTLSNFVPNGVNYLWVQGTAMDTGMASPCANLFMAELCRRACSTGQQQNRAYGGDTLMMYLLS